MAVVARLATYGTLAPGQVNHHQLSDLDGEWSTGIVKGKLIAEGWGAAHDCPGIVLKPDGDEVEVAIFASADLPDHWERLDIFEGAEYRRVNTIAQTDGGQVEVAIYEVIVA